METTEQLARDLLAQAERRDKSGRKRAFYYSVVPMVFAIALIAYTVRELNRLHDQLKETQDQLSQAQKSLHAATDLEKYIHPLDFVDLKAVYSQNPSAGDLLQRILGAQRDGVTWDPTQGLDSPGFAGRMLRTRNFEMFQKVSEPKPGDLAIYSPSYVLFYFHDGHQRPFVIGMTPFGITSLEPDFAKVTTYRRLR